MAIGEVRETGLSIVYSPPNEEPIADIIFVHGLEGHPQKTWSYVDPKSTSFSRDRSPSTRSKLSKIAKYLTVKDKKSLEVDEIERTGVRINDVAKSGIFWPQDLLRHDCDRARILTWGYDSHVIKGYESVSKNDVFAHAKNLLAILKRERAEARPIIFVAHSLGGILVKEVLRRSNESTQDSVLDIVRSTSAIVFLGTPHRGSAKAAEIGQVFREVASTLLRVDSNDRILRALGADSPELELGRESFVMLWRKYKFSVKTFQESKPLTGVNFSIMNELVVPKESSCLDDPEENAETIEANHHMMCKFYGAEDPGYIQVSGELKGFVDLIRLKQQPRRQEKDFNMLGHAGNRQLEMTQRSEDKYAAHETGYSSIGFLLHYMPLLIKAIEHYSYRVSTMDDLRVYEHVFIDSHMLLEISMNMFETYCRQMIQNLPDTQVRSLMNSQKGWDDPGVHKQLHQWLGKDSAEFVMTIKHIKKRVELLHRKLKLQAEPENSFSAWSRDSCRFDPEKYSKVINQIEKYVQRICRSMPGAADATFAQFRQIHALESWLDIQSHTYRLYNAISSTWPRGCVSHAHHAKLRLTIPTEDWEEDDPPTVKVSFATDNGIDLTQHHIWGWRDVKVISYQQQRVHAPNQEVRFSPTINPGQTPKRCTSEHEIYDICSMLKGGHQVKCLGFLHSENWHYHIHDPANYTRKMVPLKKILANQSLTTRQRRTLAFTLASGVLQLYDTPWLRDNWTLDDIYMDSKEGVDYLYVLRLFDEYGSESGDYTDTLDCVRNRTLFALGVALLELTYGAPLSAQQTAADLNDALTPHRIVGRLLKKIEYDELPQFARAVFKCINPDAEGFEFSLANQRFRRRFFQEVVLPLKKDYDELPRH